MPGKVVKDLYLATSLADLTDKTKIRTLDHPLKQLENSAKQLRESAKSFLLEGDEEKSYVLYMKFVEIALHVKKMKGVSEKEFEDMFGCYNVSSAMNKLEELQKSLSIRYSKLEESRGMSQPKVEPNLKPLKQKREKAESTDQDKSCDSSVAPYFDSWISSWELRYLIAEEKFSVLVLDTRPANDFAKSHICFVRGTTPESRSGEATVINVPKDIIRRGLTPSSLEKILPVESLRGWSKRKEVDFIVLIDWDTEKSSLKSDSTISILKDIMTKWEINFSYKQHPIILDHGYFDWINTFPMMTTNPHIEGPPKPKSFAVYIPKDDVYLSDLLSQNDVLDDLDGVVYPTLVISPPKVVPPPLSQDEASANILPVLQASVTTVPSTSEKKPVPLIDRSSKPTTAVSSPLKLSPGQPTVAKKTSNLPSTQNEFLSFNGPQETLDENNVDSESVTKERCLAESPVSNLEKDVTESTEKKEEKNAVLSKEDAEDGRKSGKVPPVDRSLKAKVLQQHGHGEGEEGEGAASARGQSGVVPKRDEAKDQEGKRKTSEVVEKRINNLNPLPDDTKEEENKQQKKKIEKDVWIAPLKLEPSPGSSAMKRSHSLQNVSRLMDDQECPKFNRSIKPVNKTAEVISTRRRNFDGVYGNVGRGLTGLRNLGNSCYMNSILQCINHTTTLVKYFCDGKYREDVNRSTKMRGEVAEEVAALVRALWSGEYRSIACRDLKGVVGMHKKAFAGYEQQDSHEFLTILMDWLHEDLNRAGQRVIQSGSGGSEASAQNASGLEGAIKSWREFCSQNESLVLQLFYGQQASTVRCLLCGEQSVTYEPFSNLSLPLPPNATRCTLSDCMSLYLKGEHITGWNCPRCKEPRDAIKKFDIWILPQILVVHFKRFTSDGWCRKRQTLVDFPLADLDVTSWVGTEPSSAGSTPSRRRKSSLYNLYGVSNHYGTMDGGHYTAHCKSSIFHKWYKFDDHEVSDLSPSDVVSPAAYILFYSSVDVS